MEYAATSLSMQDPWSLVAQRKDFPSLQEESTKRKRTETTTTKEKPTKKTRTNDDDLLNRWDLLPEAWMRGLLEIPGTSYLTILPCIKEEKIMPSEVFNIINSGRGKIIFYANVVHINICPRFLINSNEIHKHHNDSAVALCINEGGKHRLFVRCFSQKCIQACGGGLRKWEEYNESHFTRYTRLLIKGTRTTKAT